MEALFQQLKENCSLLDLDIYLHMITDSMLSLIGALDDQANQEIMLAIFKNFTALPCHPFCDQMADLHAEASRKWKRSVYELQEMANNKLVPMVKLLLLSMLRFRNSGASS
eukprot:scaffold541259_cov63-Attheya_sp.AAC.1